MLHYSLVNRISPPPTFLMVRSGTVNGILSLIKYQNIKKKISFSYHRLQEHVLFPPKPDKSYSKNKAEVK